MMQPDSIVRTVTVPADVDPVQITGPADDCLRLIESSFDANITLRGNEFTLTGSPLEVDQITSLLGDLFVQAKTDEGVKKTYVASSIRLLQSSDLSPTDLRNDVVHTHKGRCVRPKTAGQKRYVEAMRKHTVTFGLGPAGTGKTYLAVARAVAAFNAKEVSRIILSRPVVEAGESLGFLPGTLMEKVDPYMRPLYDALLDMMDAGSLHHHLDTGAIEIVPLAFMRGRTLNNGFIILDEAQNATPEQLKMFLTRLGNGSRMVVTGDATQSDLPGKSSALAKVESVLEGIDDIAFSHLSGSDVVRHSLVSEIVAAYDKAGM